MQYFNPAKLTSCDLVNCYYRLVQVKTSLESSISQKDYKVSQAVEWHPSALESPSNARKKEEKTEKFTRNVSQAMKFVLQSSCISYNYVDIVIYQKINWSFFLVVERFAAQQQHMRTE